MQVFWRGQGTLIDLVAAIQAAVADGVYGGILNTAVLNAVLLLVAHTRTCTHSHSLYHTGHCQCFLAAVRSLYLHVHTQAN